MNGQRMSFRNVRLIWKKELLDIVRDRRTLMSMIVVPLLLIPAMMFLIGVLTASSMKDLEEQGYTVAVVNEASAPALADSLREISTIEYLRAGTEEQARQLVMDGTVQAAVVFPGSAIEVGQMPAPVIQVMYQESREKSSITAKRLRVRLQDVQKSMTLAWLQRIGASEEVLEPIIIDRENLSTESDMATAGLASFLPYLLILMSITGAMYPAIDMTAGEKERATLETLLASPAGRLDIVIGKLFTVMTTSMVSTLLSLASLIATMSLGLNLLGSQVGEEMELTFAITAGSVFYTVILLLPLIALFSALLLAISIAARSSREAQSYLTPLMFLVIIPAMTSMLPGSEGSGGKAWIPVLNVSIALRDVLRGEMDPNLYTTAFISTLLYAALAVFLTVRQFQRENVLFKV